MQRRSFLKGAGAALAMAGAFPSLFGMEQFEVDFKRGGIHVEFIKSDKGNV